MLQRISGRLAPWRRSLLSSNDDKNQKLYQKYLDLAKQENNVIFGGRLGEYKYYDMDKVIESVLNLVKKELK